MTITETIKYITKLKNKEVRTDSKKFKAYLNDLSPECVKELKLLNRVLNDNILSIIFSSEKDSTIISKLTTEFKNMGMPEKQMNFILKSFANVLGWNYTQPKMEELPPKTPKKENSHSATTKTTNEYLTDNLTELLSLGYKYFNEKKYTKAIKYLQKAGELGDSGAQNIVGYMYQNGMGTEQDYREAIKWFKKSAEQNNSSAQVNLGYMHNLGLGTRQDYKEAVKWFQKAAELGDSTGQNNLGTMYQAGHGVKQDNKIAAKWFKKAAEQGSAEGQFALGNMYANGIGIDQDYKKAIECFKKAGEESNNAIANVAFNIIGDIYRNGYNGIRQDYNEAIKWYRKSAELGNSDAECNLGIMYLNAWGLEKNYKLAFKWFKKSADQWNPEAQFNLGNMYRDGLGVKQDDKEAIKWYRMSAEQGKHPMAKKALDKLLKK